MSAVAFVAEADRQVGMGHLAELRAIASAAAARGIQVRLVAIGSGAAGASDVEWIDGYDEVATLKADVMCWSVRTDRWRDAWTSIERLGARHLWIADVADDYPDVDALVIPTLSPRWREARAGTAVFAGPRYFPLDVRGPREVVPVASRTRDVLLTLGGADRTHASLRIIPTLAGTKSTVVVGPAFTHRDAVTRAASDAAIDVAVAPDGLRELLLQHRIVISAGGNTLFEAAAAGTPALVAWEDPHEKAQGTAFAALACALVIGRGADADLEQVRDCVHRLLESPEQLASMSNAGTCVVDGQGADRIATVLMELAA